MPIKLGTLLLRDAIINLTQLQEALRSQVLYGGRLGTNLVELGYLEVDKLSQYLAQIRGVGHASSKDLENASKEALTKLDPQVANQFLAIPFLLVGDNLSVALADPTNQEAMRGIEKASGCTVVPFVTPQLRILFYLEKHYGLPRAARFLRPQSTHQPGPSTERRRYRTDPPPLARIKLKRVARTTNRGAPTLTYQQACTLIDQSSSREGIANALLRYASGRLPLLALFTLQSNCALGWRLFKAGGPSGEDSLRELALPVTGKGAFGHAKQNRLPFRGSPTKTDSSEARLWAALDFDPPGEILVAPLVVEGRVVGLVYTHGESEIQDTIASELIELVVRGSSVLTEMVQG